MDNDEVEFNRSKIYEKLDYAPEPKDYSSSIPWIIQQQIAATNGIHYADRIGKLKEYPNFELPVPKITEPKLMLDIGNGWGRWLIAGANQGYIPIGMDIRLEFCKTARMALHDLNLNGYSVVGDLENIPFKSSIFDLIWSFSVIQHTHYKRLTNCLSSINDILNENGFTKLEFPNKLGIRNARKYVKDSELKKDDFNSWVVRYYTPDEYRQIFEEHLTGFKFENHSFIGIGVLKEDLKYVSTKNKLLSATSLTFSVLSRAIPGMKYYSDSLYITAKKKGKNQENALNRVKNFLELHQKDPKKNLNIVPLLKCPRYGGTLELSANSKKLESKEAGIYYPIDDDIPIMISSEARAMS